MPLHLMSLTPYNPTQEDVDQLIWTIMNGVTTYYERIKMLYHFRKELVDQRSGEPVGNVIVSLVGDQKTGKSRYVDVDLSFYSDEPVRIQLENKIGENSFANQHFNAVYLEVAEQHFCLETVNRFGSNPELDGTEVSAYISIFPQRVTVYKDLKELNRAYGLPKEIENPAMREIGITSICYSDTFIAAFEDYNKVFGTVVSMKDVELQMDPLTLNFVLAKVRTGFGIVPVAMSRELFDLENLAPGCALDIEGRIVADLGDPNMFVPAPKE